MTSGPFRTRASNAGDEGAVDRVVVRDGDHIEADSRGPRHDFADAVRSIAVIRVHVKVGDSDRPPIAGHRASVRTVCGLSAEPIAVFHWEKSV